MKPVTTLVKRCLGKISAPGILKAWLWLGVMALCATTANAQLTWLHTDVGTTTLPGSVIDNGGGSYTIVGGGADIWGTADGCHFLYAWGSGQTWDAIVEITAFSGPDYWSKCELMVRASDPLVGPLGGDAFVADMATLNTYGAPPGTAARNAVIDQFRSHANANADWKQAGTDPVPIYPGTWMKIHRNGPVLSIYYCMTNGTPGASDWTHYFDIDTSGVIPLTGQDNGTTFGPAGFPDIVAVGVAVTAHNDADATGAIATIANLSATFPAATAPTAVTLLQQTQGVATNVLGGEASLSILGTNNTVPAIVPTVYQWYKNGLPIPNATNRFHTWLLQASDDGLPFYCKAGCPPPYTSVPQAQSDTFTAKVLPSTYYTNSLRMEFFSGGGASPGRVNVENGNVGPATWLTSRPNFDDPGNYGNNYVSRMSGWFIPPADGNYVFFLAADDDTDLFLSTDDNPANKQLIAQETGWSGTDQWLPNNAVPPNNGGTIWSQARSDQWTNDLGVTLWASGIPLSGGHLCYIEAVHSQGGGGDNLSVTYQTLTQVNDPNWLNVFNNGTNSLMQAGSNCLVIKTIPATTLTWVTQPAASVTATLGFKATFQSLAASDSEFRPNYQWYTGLPPTGVAVPGATAANYTTPNTTAGDQGTTFYVVATTAENELSITSTVATLNVALPVLEKGWAYDEYWYSAEGADPGVDRFRTTNAANNAVMLRTDYTTVPHHAIFEPRFEGNSRGQAGANFTDRLSGYFYPPATDDYVFFVNSDDESDLFVSTNSSPAGARLVAQETGWSGSWQWTAVGGGSSVTQKRSDQWTDPWQNVPGQFGYHMIKDQQYYVAIVHHEGGEGDNVEATFKSINDPTDPPLGSYSKMTGKLIASFAPRCFSMSFSQQPGTVNASLGGLATLTAVGATDSTSAVGDNSDPRPEWNDHVIYQWTKNGVPIPGAVSSTYKFGPVSPIDATLSFACTIRALGYTDGSGNPLWATSTVANIVLSGNAVYEPGFAFHRYWSSNPGRTTIEANTAGNPSWVMGVPGFAANDQNVNFADNYSDDLVGFFIPPSNGSYVFFTSSDDDSDLFISTDASASGRRLVAQETGWGVGPLNWGQSANGPAAQTRSDTFVDPATSLTLYSNGIPLIGGQKYFIQAVHHEGGGGDWVCATYMNTNDINYPNAPANGTVSAFRGSQLGSYVPACTNVTVTINPQPVTANSYASATFTAGATTDSTVPVGTEGDWRPYMNNYLFFQWYKNGTLVPNAAGPTYTIPQVLPSDNNSTVFCRMRALGYADIAGNALWVTSSVAPLTVITGAPPELLFSAIYTNFTAGVESTYVTLNFSSPMDPVALSNPLNYTLGGGLGTLSIQTITVNSNNYKNVVLTVTGTPTGPFTVTVTSGSALGGGLALTGSHTTGVNRIPLTSADIGNAGDPAIPSGFYPSGTNAFTVECEGSDIWNNADGFNFSYEMKTGDFDVVVRQKSTTHTSNWAKGGLMVRETLDANSRDWNIVNDPASADGIMAPDGSGLGANAVECNARVDTSGASAAWSGGVAGTVPAYPNAWVRLTRVGQLLSAYWSTNNASSWNLAAINDPAAASTLGLGDLPAAVYVGICATAHNNDAAGTPASELRFMAYMDFDSYNSSYVYVPPTTVTINAAHVVGGNIVITWTPGVGTLKGSPFLTGPGVDWQTVGTGGSASIPIGAAPRFFMVRP